MNGGFYLKKENAGKTLPPKNVSGNTCGKKMIYSTHIFRLHKIRINALELNNGAGQRIFFFSII